MKKRYLCSLFFFLLICAGKAQQVILTNTDQIYRFALEEYRSGNFERSLQYTRRGLELAPEYHDIRVLQTRNHWALEQYEAADRELDFLLAEAPGYPDVKQLVYQRINLFKTDEEAHIFLKTAETFYPDDTRLQARKAAILIGSGRRDEARKLALAVIRRKDLSGEDLYLLQNILHRTISTEFGINYQYISFSEEYFGSREWHILSGELQHNVGRTAVIGRATFSDRGINSGTLYEIEAYPVLNNRLYLFTNVGFSDGTVFPEYRGSLSLFYNFAGIFEAELGGRLLHFNDTGYFSGITGLTAYFGSFYVNGRVFLGPERMEQMSRNYQANVRYYFGNADNFLFTRIGSGISPDERIIFTQVLEKPGLEAYYLNAGINKSLGSHHLIQLSGGFLQEEITPKIKGYQIMFNLGYRYRF